MNYIIRKMPAFRYDDLDPKAKSKALEDARQTRSDVELPDDITEWLRDQLWEAGFTLHGRGEGPWWDTFSQGSGVAWACDDIHLDRVLDKLGWDRHDRRRLKAAIDKYGIAPEVKKTTSNYCHYRTMEVEMDWEAIPDAKYDHDFDKSRRYVLPVADPGNPTGAPSHYETRIEWHRGFVCQGMRKPAESFAEELLEYVRDLSIGLHREIETMILDNDKEERLIEDGYLANGWYSGDGKLICTDADLTEADDTYKLETKNV